MHQAWDASPKVHQVKLHKTIIWCTNLIADVGWEVLYYYFSPIIKLSSRSFQTAGNLFWTEGHQFIIEPSRTVATRRRWALIDGVRFNLFARFILPVFRFACLVVTCIEWIRGKIGTSEGFLVSGSWANGHCGRHVSVWKFVCSHCSFALASLNNTHMRGTRLLIGRGEMRFSFSAWGAGPTSHVSNLNTQQVGCQIPPLIYTKIITFSLFYYVLRNRFCFFIIILLFVLPNTWYHVKCPACTVMCTNVQSVRYCPKHTMQFKPNQIIDTLLQTSSGL